MDLGFVTHAVHANSRLVYLVCTVEGDSVTCTGPPNENIYPPGPGWLYVVVDGVPSKGIKVMVGEGKDPEVDQAALKKYVKFQIPPTKLMPFISVLEKTAVDQPENGDGTE